MLNTQKEITDLCNKENKRIYHLVIQDESGTMKTMAMAFSTSEVNCTMGKIVASPTAGSAGILPAAMIAAKEKYGFDKETLENGLLTAIGIGQIIAKYATFAGAEGGCQAMGEVGKLLDPDLRETGLGGVAGTKTGNRIREEFLSDQEE